MPEYPNNPGDVAGGMDPDDMQHQQWIERTFPTLDEKVEAIRQLLIGHPRSDLDEAWDMTSRYDDTASLDATIRRAQLAKQIMLIVGDNNDQLWDLIYDRLPKELR